jgi:transcriptional regulator with XRE-family HTH domain
MGKSSAGKASEFSLRVVDEIETARIQAGITQAELFAAVGMSQNYFYSRLRGDLPFNTNDIDKLALALGCNPLELLRNAASPSLNAVGTHRSTKPRK